MRWPNHIPAATVSNEPIAAIDIMPTIAKLTEAKLSTNKIDGKDISDLMFAKPNAKSPHDAIYYYFVNELQAVRSGKWKLHLPHKYRTLNGRKGNTDGTPIKYNYPNTPLSLYDLSIDIGEKNNVADKHPDIVKRLKNLAQNMRKDLGDKLTNTTGTGRREPEKIA
jgi:arylsulfatase A-like enzyme